MTETLSIQVGTAVKTTMKWPHNEGIVTAVNGWQVEITKYGAGKTRDYVGGGTFNASILQVTPDEEINAALEQIASHKAVAAQLRREREAKGLRLESKAEADLLREARRIQRNIDSL